MIRFRKVSIVWKTTEEQWLWFSLNFSTYSHMFYYDVYDSIEMCLLMNNPPDFFFSFTPPSVDPLWRMRRMPQHH